jgi:hypothetical protein
LNGLMIASIFFIAIASPSHPDGTVAQPSKHPRLCYLR